MSPSPAEQTAAWVSALEAELLARRRSQRRRVSLRRVRGRIAVVTDSASGLPMKPGDSTAAVGTVGEHITIVPIPVMIDFPHQAQIYSEVSEELERDLPLAVAQGVSVRTSRPAPGRLAEVYRDLQRAGFAGIVSVHLSAKLSGTVEAARLAAQQVDVPVTVVDSQQAGLALGEAVIQAALAARLGADLRTTAAAAREAAASAEATFVVPSLEQLRRGGRINRLSSLLGSVMGVKPLLGIRAGEVALIERPRSFSRAVDRLLHLALEQAADHPAARVGVHCFGNRAEGVGLAQSLQQASAAPVPVVELPPALGAHLGLGALAVTVVEPAKEPSTGADHHE